MGDIYPIPNASDTGDLQEIFRFVNDSATAGIFFPIILLTIWLIAFIGAIAEGREAYRAWIFASFISTILAIILGLLGFLQPSYIYFLIIMLGVGMIWAKLTQGRGF